MNALSTQKASGFTMLELLIVIAVMATLTALAVPSFSSMREARRLKESSIAISGAMTFARAEAIRTGNVHLLFVGTDAEGNGLQDASSNPVPILVLDDGRPGSAGQNCKIDSAEPFRTLGLNQGVTSGIATGTTRAPGDFGNGAISTGSSFSEPGGSAATWVMFRPDGAPLAFDENCVVGPTGSGSGAFYLTNGTRNVGVVLSPMGAIRVHGWNAVWSL